MPHEHSVSIELASDSSDLYIFFGGIRSGISIPPFEFYKSAGILDDHKIFVRDLEQCWYQAGLPGISRVVHETADYLHKQIERILPEQVRFVGNSMGGFAAILFHALIGTGQAIAFSPQTFISPRLRLKHGERPWRRETRRTYRKSLFKQTVWDLKPLLSEKRNDLNISVFVSTGHRRDLAHAHHTEHLPGVTIHTFDSGGHAVVKLLRDRGELPLIMSGHYAGWKMTV